MRKRIDIIGNQYGRWTVVRFYDSDINRTQYYECRCECGVIKTVARNSIVRGLSTSCGCRRSEVTTTRNFRHGSNTRFERTGEYSVWAGMISRCQNKKCKAFKNYGGRGIFVCQAWKGINGFATFIKDMGTRPTDLHTIERKNNDGPYSKVNCKWATRKEQSRNKRTTVLFTFQGQSLTLTDWAEKTGINLSKLSKRYYVYGWDIHRVLTTR